MDLSSLKMYLRMRDQIISGDKAELDENGVCATFTELIGWWEAPSTTSSVTQRAYDHGVYANKAFHTERNITISGEMFAANRVALRKGLERLVASVPITTFEPFIVFEDGVTRHVMVRQGGPPTIEWAGWMNEATGQLEATFSIQLIAASPQRLSGDGSGPTKVRATTPGLSAQSLTVTNAGTGTLPPVVLKFTNATRPTLRVNGDNTKTLLFDTTVGPGDLLVVDLKAKTVKLNGVNAYTTKRGDWLRLLDSGNTFTFYADAVGSTGQMIVETYDSDL